MTTLTIDYYTGKMNLNLDVFIPAKSAQLRLVVDTIVKSKDPEGNAKLMYDYISSKVQALKEMRSHCEPSSSYDKPQIAKLTSQIRSYTSNAEIIRKVFKDLPEISDGEKIILKSADIYAMMNIQGEGLKVYGFKGWTFSKYGYSFEVRYIRKAKRYAVMIPGTGMQFVSVTSRAQISSSITEREIEWIKNHEKDLETAKNHFEKLFSETETIIFPDENITVKNYRETPETAAETVQEQPEEKTEKFAEVAIVPEEEKKEDSAAETVKEQPEEKTEYPSGRRADIPEKTWIGSRIDGNGFTIYFNPETMRTEIQAIEKYIPDLVSAGFYKTNHGTYNKKLTWKAYRAAVKLSEKWNAA